MLLPALLAEEARRFATKTGADQTAMSSCAAQEPHTLNLQDVTITGLTADSRTVAPGHLFAALPGTRADGQAFIPEALRRGATAILGNQSATAYASTVPVIVDPTPRRRLATLAAPV